MITFEHRIHIRTCFVRTYCVAGLRPYVTLNAVEARGVRIRLTVKSGHAETGNLLLKLFEKIYSSTIVKNATEYSRAPFEAPESGNSSFEVNHLQQKTT